MNDEEIIRVSAVWEIKRNAEVQEEDNSLDGL